MIFANSFKLHSPKGSRNFERIVAFIGLLVHINTYFQYEVHYEVRGKPTEAQCVRAQNFILILKAEVNLNLSEILIV